jgi:hypothetical protein
MGRKSGILLIVAGALLLAPFLCLPLYVYAHHYYTVGLSIDAPGYAILVLMVASGIALVTRGFWVLRSQKPQ